NRQGFGGRKCDQCRTNYWGNPSDNSCRPCNCDPQGSSTQQVDELMNQIDEFLEESGASPADIRSLATDVLSKGISLRPEQITDLARRNNDTFSSLTSIDAILAETSGDLASAKALKDRADTAKAHAQGILTVVQQVLDSLVAAKAAQDKAEEAIQTADKDISAAVSHL
ncbi:Laminin subunit beta-1, partial [Daphnia magna]